MKADECRMKIASHQLRAANMIFEITYHKWEHTDLPLSLPLCCIVDYRGYRVFAAALLPLGDTLIYGSSDGGATICSSDVGDRIANYIASPLGLKEHQAQFTGSKRIFTILFTSVLIFFYKNTDINKQMKLPFNTEIHFTETGKRLCSQLFLNLLVGRYYILDMAPIFAPETPKKRFWIDIVLFLMFLD